MLHRSRATTPLRALALVLAGAGPLAAAEQSFPADANGLVSFQLPSGNIGCTFVPEGGTPVYLPVDGGPELICERIEPAYATMILGPAGAAQIIMDPGEQGCCSGPVLDYGNTWQEGPFRCASERTGLTCERDDGRGFSMARARIEVF